jgi:hypothetical protein
MATALACVAALTGGAAVARADEPLSYHGGPVMHDNTAFVIFWAPPGYHFDPEFEQGVTRYLADAQKAIGSPDSVYSVAGQYFDTTGPAAQGSRFGGAVSVEDAAGDPRCASPGLTVCLDPGQVRAELGRVVDAQHWPRGMGSVFFLLTPPGVGSCMAERSSHCSYADNCAYHDSSGAGDRAIVFAYLAWQEAPGTSKPCESGNRPNASVVDPTVDALSHEHIEMLTDPLLDAWYDAHTDEIADKCRSAYGRALGSTAFGPYNQILGSGRYWLQQQWSNAAGQCVGHTSARRRPARGQDIVVSLPPPRGSGRHRHHGRRHHRHLRPAKSRRSHA